MRIQWKVTLVVFLVLLGTLSAVVWKTQSLLYEDKVSFLADAALKQIAPMKRLAQERLDVEKGRLIRFASTRATLGAPRASLFHGFEVVSLMQTAENGQWTPTWIEKNKKSKAERWPAGHELNLLKTLPYGKIRDGDSTWVRVSDAQGSPIYALLVSVEVQSNATATDVADASHLPDGGEPSHVTPSGSGKRAVVVGFFNSNPLATVTDDFIGSMNVVYLVDERGYVASHVNKGYLGALFSEDSLVKEITKGQRSSTSGRFDDIESRPVIGHFERVDRTNLYAVVTTPMQAVTGLLEQNMRISLLTGFGVGLFGLVVAWLVGRGISQPLQATIGSLLAINRGDMRATVVPSGTDDEIGVLTRLLAESSPTALASKQLLLGQQKGVALPGRTESASMATAAIASPTSNAATTTAKAHRNSEPERLAQERRAAFEAFSDGFVASLREPLLAIIGHTQLAKAQSPADDSRSHIESVEREARRAKEILEKMKVLSNESVTPPGDDEVKLADIVDRALKNVEALIHADGIEVSKDLHPIPSVRGSATEIEGALTHVLENSIEAMKARPKRRLRVHTEFLGEQVYLLVTDTGIGMSRDVKARAFEPFFKKFESPKRMGLGLAFVKSTLKRHGAKAEIDSTPGDGTVFRFKFPVEVQDKARFNNIAAHMNQVLQSVETTATGAGAANSANAAGAAASSEPNSSATTPVSAEHGTREAQDTPPPVEPHESDLIDLTDLTLAGRKALDHYSLAGLQMPPDPIDPEEELTAQSEPHQSELVEVEQREANTHLKDNVILFQAQRDRLDEEDRHGDHDDDEDDEDNFQNMTLANMTLANLPLTDLTPETSSTVAAPTSTSDVTKVSRVEPSTPPPSAQASKHTSKTGAVGETTRTQFQVKIRKPRAK